MHHPPSSPPSRPVLVLAVLALSVSAAVHGDSPQAAFARENEAAMQKMMQGMAVRPSGDVDRDFAAMMIPHHQGAIDMAIAELRYGRNEQLRRIAQEIVVDQQQEIAAMRLALGLPPPPAAAAPSDTAAIASGSGTAAGHTQHVMPSLPR